MSALAREAFAEIVDNAFWATHNFTDSATSVTVTNGKVSGADDVTDQFMTSPWTAVGDPEDYLNQPNVARVQTLFTQILFESEFSGSVYSYDSFLKAVAKFPAFCDETANPLGYDLTDTCKRELAAFFANVDTTSSSLTVAADPDCVNSSDATACGFKGDPSLSSPADSFFYGRGPLALTSDSDYADFSSVFYEGYDRS